IPACRHDARPDKSRVARARATLAHYLPAVPSQLTLRTNTESMKTSSHKKSNGSASQKVERAMHEMKRGQLRSGGSGKKVTSRKQAIAIGLSEARREGGKVPRAPSSRKKK